jgi:hypothetical protein
MSLSMSMSMYLVLAALNLPPELSSADLPLLL